MEMTSAQQIWRTALGELEIQVNKSNYHTWLQKTVGLDYHDNHFIIGAPNTFVAEYLDRNQRSLIERVLSNLVHNEVEAQFKVSTDPGNAAASYATRGKNIPVQQTSLALFNPRYTFDSFVVGRGNLLAYAAARGVSQDPGRSYNPLFIYGGAGLGKTHLLQAIGQTAVANKQKTVYASAEHYTNDLVTAIRERKTDDFRDKYRSADMLLIDDVQFFGGKEQTEETFFHTFNELHNSSRQIVLVSNCPPKDIPLLPERLRSRFEWGLVTDVQPPDFETRLAILQAKAKKEGIAASADVLEHIALQVQQNIRALEGALNKVVAYARLMRANLSTELVTEALKDTAGNEAKRIPVTPALIVETVANTFQMALSDLKGRKRDEPTVLARQVAMYLIRQDTDCSLAAVGKELGNRSPATVTHAYQKIANDISNDPQLRRKVLGIQQKYAPAT
ncbi:MAG: chromosomal replication initiator protein DnaA [Chloroflexota bacterium]